MNREAIIIPNQAIVESGGGVFIKKLEKNEHHSQAIKEYSDKYNLGLTFESLGIPEGTFYGEFWQNAIATLGQVFVSIEETTIIYLPENLSLF